MCQILPSHFEVFGHGPAPFQSEGPWCYPWTVIETTGLNPRVNETSAHDARGNRCDPGKLSRKANAHAATQHRWRKTFRSNESTNQEHILERVERYPNSDVGKVIWAVCYGATTNCLSKMSVFVDGSHLPHACREQLRG